MSGYVLVWCQRCEAAAVEGACEKDDERTGNKIGMSDAFSPTGCSFPACPKFVSPPNHSFHKNLYRVSLNKSLLFAVVLRPIFECGRFRPIFVRLCPGIWEIIICYTQN